MPLTARERAVHGAGKRAGHRRAVVLADSRADHRGDLRGDAGLGHSSSSRPVAWRVPASGRSGIPVRPFVGPGIRAPPFMSLTV